MPLTTGFTSRTATKGEGHIHTDKWHRCIEHVKAKGGGYEPHAVCTHAIGYKESINPEHRTPGPHASANTRRFKESAKRRREAKKVESYAAVLKLDVQLVLKEHKCWGHECGTGGKRHPAEPARDADARPARSADARPARDASARPAKDESEVEPLPSDKMFKASHNLANAVYDAAAKLKKKFRKKK